MRRFMILAALVAMPLPAVASGWMGSLQFTNGYTSGWTASLKGGEGKMKTSLGKLDVQKSNSFFIVSTRKAGIVGAGVVENGHVAGTFSYGAFGGNFMGDRVSNGKGGKGKK